MRSAPLRPDAPADPAVYPREIEEVLHEHPAVALAAVLGVPDAHPGEEIAAAVVLHPGAAATPDELRLFVKVHVRVSVVEPGSVDTELRSHNSEVVQQLLNAGLGDIDRLQSEDIADAVASIATRPRHVAIAELLVRPTEQA